MARHEIRIDRSVATGEGAWHRARAMSPDQISQLKSLEGRQVGVALTDGTRIDDAQLVSSGRGHARTLWVFTNGLDAFVPLVEVVDVWEAAAA